MLLRFTRLLLAGFTRLGLVARFTRLARLPRSTRLSRLTRLARLTLRTLTTAFTRGIRMWRIAARFARGFPRRLATQLALRFGAVLAAFGTTAFTTAAFATAAFGATAFAATA